PPDRQVALDDPLVENLADEVKGAPGAVKAHDELPSRPENPIGLADAPHRVGRVVQDAHGVDDIEVIRGVVDVGRVAQLQLDGKTSQGEVFPCQSMVAFGDVDAVNQGAGFRKGYQVGSDAVADLQHPFAAGGGERDGA